MNALFTSDYQQQLAIELIYFFSLFTEKMMKINFLNISFKMILSKTKMDRIPFSILTRDNL